MDHLSGNQHDNDDDHNSAKPSAQTSTEGDVEDDDDWSRQVQTDETTAGQFHEDSFRMMESVVEGTDEDEVVTAAAAAIPQPQRELTMKEKLVMRERERRIETERARLKRQFALNNEAPSTTPQAAPSSRGSESVAGTLGEESIVAHPDEEESAEEARRLGFNMERFLRNSDSFNPQLEPTTEEGALPPGVLMERFLNEPVERSEVTRSVSFDMEGSGRPVTVEPAPVPVSNLASYGEDDGSTSVEANASMLVDDDNDAVNASNLPDERSDIASSSTPATEEPRVLRLTEADMQEMVAIEEASIGNAPPSEREEMLSEIGELADFGGSHTAPMGNFSLDTPTTAMESTSVPDRTDHRSLEGMVAASVSSHLSPGGSANDTVEANPPSERATPSMTLPDEDIMESHLDSVQQPFLEPNGLRPEPDSSRAARDTASTPTRGVYQGMSRAEWSPAAPMGVSPLQPRISAVPGTADTKYGTLEASGLPLLSMTHGDEENNKCSEAEPLLSDVPPEIITRHQTAATADTTEHALCPSVRTAVDTVSRDVRSAAEKNAIHQDSEKYTACTVLERAFSDRILVLIVTLVLELPVLFMIAGGSDALCSIVGRKRYHLLMGMLPLSSAISGNVGLQSSSLTSRAIAHNHVTGQSYGPWVGAEVGAAACLALVIGCMLGLVAFVASDYDWAFALTMIIAQFTSMIIGGLTGTLAPLLCRFVFKGDADKWTGPLETVTQDIVGSFTMVVISYQILSWLEHRPIDPSDMCIALHLDTIQY